MKDSRSVETEIEVDLYEEIVGNLNYTTTPVTDRSSRPISYSEDRTRATTFKGPITHTSESTVITSASAAIVTSVTWPDLRSPCSVAGNNQVPRPAACAALGRKKFEFCDTIKLAPWAAIEAAYFSALSVTWLALTSARSVDKRPVSENGCIDIGVTRILAA